MPAYFFNIFGQKTIECIFANHQNDKNDTYEKSKHYFLLKTLGKKKSLGGQGPPSFQLSAAQGLPKPKAVSVNLTEIQHLT